MYITGALITEVGGPMLVRPHERTVEVAWNCPAPCSPDHRRQHPVRRSLSTVWLAYVSRTTF